jgi:hypothetical protein
MGSSNKTPMMLQISHNTSTKQIIEVNANNIKQNILLLNGPRKSKFLDDLISKQNIAFMSNLKPKNTQNLRKSRTIIPTAKIGDATVISSGNIPNLDTLKSNERVLKFSYCDIIRKPFCQSMANSKTRRKYQLYNKSHDILLDYLDISNIVHRLEEFSEKFKYTMLNREQLAMFQFIAKDICSTEDKGELQNEIGKLKALAQNKTELLKVIVDYKNKLGEHRDEISPIDKKLFSMLDGKLNRSSLKVERHKLFK